jgi:protein O-GlcNAc transferase
MEMTEISKAKNLQTAEDHRLIGSLSVAEELYRLVLASDPNCSEANHGMGLISISTNDLKGALIFLHKAICTDPQNLNVWLDYINVLRGHFSAKSAIAAISQSKLVGLESTALEAILNELIGEYSDLEHAQTPTSTEMELLLDFLRCGMVREVESIARAMTLRFPDHVFGWKVLGAVLNRLGRQLEALEALQKSVQIAPSDPEAHNNYGNCLRELGDFRGAAKEYTAALQLNNKFAEAYNNLGIALRNLEDYAGAIENYQLAISQKPDYADAFNNLGLALQELGQLGSAESALRRAIELRPVYPEALNNLGNVLKDLGHFTQALSSYQQVLSFSPRHFAARSNALLCSSYQMDGDAVNTKVQAKIFGELASSMVSQPYTKWLCEMPAEKMRIGFVSGDLCQHPVGYFLEGLLSKIDSSRFELTAYATSTKADELTSRIKPLFRAWRSIFAVPDDAAAKMIHEDGVHLLIDLSGHTAHNRLTMFAHRPAPVQATWLGYCGTTGVKEIDYLLGDAYVTPANDESHFVESIWRLPQSYICLTPLNIDLRVGDLPAKTNGFVTFGSFNNLSKMTDQVIELWSGVLLAVNGSKLYLKSRQLGDEFVRIPLIEKFNSLGIKSERLILEGVTYSREDHLACYNRVDIALDTFPYNGVTTTAEALWMGVPVLTLIGDRFISRNGLTILNNCDLSEWIAKDGADFIQKATYFTQDINALAARRKTQRQQVLKSPLFDSITFARHFEDAILQMWQAHLLK